MAAAPVYVPAIIGGIGLATAAYSARNQQQQEKKADEAANAPKPTGPVTPNLSSQTANQQAEQKLAVSAGGTVTDPNANVGGQIGNAPLTPRKTLLGS